MLDVNVKYIWSHLKPTPLDILSLKKVPHESSDNDSISTENSLTALNSKKKKEFSDISSTSQELEVKLNSKHDSDNEYL